jgi:transcriptional regulator with XRE-family HTH domain
METTFAQMYDVITNKLPKRLKILRELHNYTQEYVAESLKMSQANYGNLERETSKISIDKIELFCQLYKISVDELFEFDLTAIVKRKNIDL